MRRRIGAGAFATVWLAYDEQLDSPVAIKVLADNFTEDHHVRQRFIEEGRFLRKVESPHVVAVYDAGELADARPFLVMSYADQGTLEDRLELAPLTPPQALHVLTETGAGLHALHQRGVLHRDVKPANVLFRTIEIDGSPQVSAMLGDLGLGKAIETASGLTMIGGTPSYVAPEQAQGEPLDARADQFSLAALAYLLLAGRVPYNHSSLTAAADHCCPAPMGNAVPPAAEAVIAKGLAKERDDRYDDVAAFVGALTSALPEVVAEPLPWLRAESVAPSLASDVGRHETAQPDPGPDPTPPSRPGRPRRRRAAWLAAGLAALAVGVALGYLTRPLLVTERTIKDSSQTIAVTVPKDWTRAVDTEQWVPPDGEAEQPALSAGTSVLWNGNDQPGEGVFVAVLPGESLPTSVPQHPECDPPKPAVNDRRDGDDYVTVEFTGCDHGGITLERVILVTANRLLWVQVRAADSGTANRVLNSVEVSGTLKSR